MLTWHIYLGKCDHMISSQNISPGCYLIEVVILGSMVNYWDADFLASSLEVGSMQSNLQKPLFRLLHNPSLLAVWLSVGYEKWHLIGWYHPYVIG